MIHWNKTIKKRNNRVIKTLFLYGLMLVPFTANGQDLISSMQQGIQSPEAASLGKYGDVPVSYYTGTPNITIPIYTVQASGGFTLPINLSYHASGIKVNEIASWVGLGWSLNAGGVITRTVRGLPDDKTNFGYLSTYTYINDDSFWPYSTVYNYRTGNIPTCFDDDLPCKVRQGKADTEPDIYFLNFNGHSGSMFSGPWGNATIPYKGLKVTGSPVDDEWTIITKDGTRYLFGSGPGYTERIEQTIDVDYATGQGGNSWETYNSAWYLRKIELPNSDEVIRFNYTPHMVWYGTMDKVAEKEQLNSAYIDGVILKKSYQETQQQNTIRKPVLTSIETNNETIEFIFDSNRLDKPFGTASDLVKLDEIKVFTKQSDLKKHIRLDFEYFNQGQTNAQRLRLDSVTEVSLSGSGGLIYQFGYNEDQNLPLYGSFDKDFWGYYNGAGNSNSALPEVDILGVPGANRKSAWPEMQANMLKRIVYPTGGYTDFTWEPNDYSKVGDKDLTDFELQKKVVTASVLASFKRLAIDQYNDGTYDDNGNKLPALGTVEKEFTVPADSASKKIKLTIYWPFLTGSSQTQSAEIKIYNENGTNIKNFLYYRDYQGNANYPNPTQHSLNVSPGTYTISMSGVSVCSSSCKTTWFNLGSLIYNMNVSWLTTKTDNTAPLYRIGGGLRVKKIASYSGESSDNSEILNFTYLRPSDTARSSGAIVSEPQYYFSVYLPNIDNEIYMRQSTSTVPLGSVGGKSVGYSAVKVSFGANGEGGSKIYYYTNAGDYPDINLNNNRYGTNPSSGINYAALNWSATSNEWRRGHLVREEEYTSDNTLARRTSYSFDFHMQGLSLLDRPGVGYSIDSTATSPLVKVLRGASYFSPVSYSHNHIWTSFVQQNPYYLVAGWFSPSQKTIETFGPNGLKIEREKRFLYEENPSNRALGQLRKEVDSFAGQKRVTNYMYAHEHYDNMHSQHMLSQPYSTAISDSTGNVLSKHWILWSVQTGFWRPRSEWIWTGGNPAAPVFENN